MSCYKSFIHVERLDKEETEGILNGTCYISPKIDGTNSVVFLKNGELTAGSRTRELSEGQSDNASFRQWVQENGTQVQLMRRLLEDHPDYLIYGEWLGYDKFIGNIKDYNKNALKTLHIFDIYDSAAQKYLHPKDIDVLLYKYDLSNYAVPTLIISDSFTEEQIEKIAETNFYLLDSADHPGEGVVIRNPDYINKYGHYTIAKYVRPEYKHNKTKPKKNINNSSVEESIVDRYVTNEEISKAVAKICLLMNMDAFEVTNASMGRLLNEVWTGAICDEIKDILKKFKNPTIDFATLKYYCDAAVREYLKL